MASISRKKGKERGNHWLHKEEKKKGNRVDSVSNGRVKKGKEVLGLSSSDKREEGAYQLTEKKKKVLEKGGESLALISRGGIPFLI